MIFYWECNITQYQRVLSCCNLPNSHTLPKVQSSQHRFFIDCEVREILGMSLFSKKYSIEKKRKKRKHFSQVLALYGSLMKYICCMYGTSWEGGLRTVFTGRGIEMAIQTWLWVITLWCDFCSSLAFFPVHVSPSCTNLYQLLPWLLLTYFFEPTCATAQWAQVHRLSAPPQVRLSYSRLQVKGHMG